MVIFRRGAKDGHVEEMPCGCVLVYGQDDLSKGCCFDAHIVHVARRCGTMKAVPFVSLEVARESPDLVVSGMPAIRAHLLFGQKWLRHIRNHNQELIEWLDESTI